METSVIIEKPLLELYSYNDNGEEIRVRLFADDLRRADLGTKWEAYVSCTRCAESAEIVYKNAAGVAVLYQEFGTINGEDYEDSPELIWIQLHFVDETVQKPPRRRQEQEDENTTKEEN